MSEKKQGEKIQIDLTIQGVAPTGTPQVTIFGFLTVTDLASDGAGTGISSATGGFEAGMVNSYINITGGTGFTPGNYLVSGYTDTNNITISSSAGASASGGTGIVGNYTVLAATNMVQGASTYIWYYDYVIDAAAPVGQYKIIRAAVINGVTYYAVDNYDVSAAEFDSLDAKIDTLQTDLTAVKTQTDKMTFDASNNQVATLDAGLTNGGSDVEYD